MQLQCKGVVKTGFPEKAKRNMSGFTHSRERKETWSGYVITSNIAHK